jgi:predicted transcriptional regulator
MKELTKAEEQIMRILWNLKKGFVRDIIEVMPEPKPAYNTVSTIIRILEKKGFVGHKAYGKAHEYYPAVEKEEYTRDYLNNIVGNYFSGSFSQLVSFFTKEENLSVGQLEELKSMIDKEIHKKK